MSMQKRNNFTLLEVLVSLAILTMGLMIALSQTANSTSRSIRAEVRWHEQHMLAQAAEFYLLAGPNEALPRSIFNYDGYRASCVVEDAEEGLHTEALEDIGSWRLMNLTVNLIGPNGDIADSLKIDKIMNRDDL